MDINVLLTQVPTIGAFIYFLIRYIDASEKRLDKCVDTFNLTIKIITERIEDKIDDLSKIIEDKK